MATIYYTATTLDGFLADEQDNLDWLLKQPQDPDDSDFSYETFIADKRYAEIAKHIGLPFGTTEEGVAALVDAIRDLNEKLHIPIRVSENGISEKDYFRDLEGLSVKAFEDQCTGTNPRAPLVSEIKTIFEKIW